MQPLTRPAFDAVDLFAGPGGWDEGARALGLRTVGVEWDHSACLTAVAAGHPRVRADVRTVPVEPFVGVRGLIASPPCPTFSAAGKGSGRHDLPLLLLAIKRLGVGEWPGEQIAACEDDRTALTLEPLRWALALQPEWVALEQVPAVLPVWEAMAEVLRAHGYSVATGSLQAEQYGVPQTRRRAVLVASRVREVALPAPTHTKYGKGKPRQQDGLEPWVSMADALGWGMDARPSVTVASTTDTGAGGPRPLDGGSELPAMTKAYGAGMVERHGERPDREATEPAFTITAAEGGGSERLRWTHDRPATTVVASFAADTIAGPGWRKAGDGPRQNAAGSVRVSVQEAGVLQSFPADYPWQGARTKQYQQVGNAVPPLLALAVLEAVL